MGTSHPHHHIHLVVILYAIRVVPVNDFKQPNLNDGTVSNSIRFISVPKESMMSRRRHTTECGAAQMKAKPVCAKIESADGGDIPMFATLTTDGVLSMKSCTLARSSGDRSEVSGMGGACQKN